MRRRATTRRTDAQAPKDSQQALATKPSGEESSWHSALAHHRDKIVGALVIGLLAAIGVWIEPLKDAVLHKIYTERAEVALLIDRSEIALGQTVQVRLRVSPSSKIDVAEGLVRLVFDPDHFTLAPNTSDSFNVKRLSSARILDEGSFTLFPRPHKADVTSQLSVAYITKYATHKSQPIMVKILAQKTDDLVPYFETGGSRAINLSGNFQIEIGGALGGMKIRQDARSDIVGEYWMNGEGQKMRLPIEGYKDGTSLKVFFLKNSKGTIRWRIDSNFTLNSIDPRFIEIQGCAYSIVRDPSVIRDSEVPTGGVCKSRDYVGWRGDGATTFYATAQMR